MRPYQIAATEKILNRIVVSTNYKKTGSLDAGGYIWHTTGTGKTMVAAFDYKEQRKDGDKKLLFLAHRKEILDQSLYTFRNVLKDQKFGELWVGNYTPSEDTHLFASSYLEILEYYNPRILLGLTATPERMDGKNILDYFNNRIASEIRLTDAINRKPLSPFHYFGVTDPEDLSHLKWSRGGYGNFLQLCIMIMQRAVNYLIGNPKVLLE